MPTQNVYIPDALHQRIEAADGLNLSGIFQDAVTRELDRRDELAAAVDGMVPQKVEATDNDGSPVVLEFDGKVIVDHKDVAIYLLDDGRVLVVFEEGWEEFEDREQFEERVDDEQRNNLGRSIEGALREAATDLGAPRRVRL